MSASGDRGSGRRKEIPGRISLGRVVKRESDPPLSVACGA